MKNKSTTNPMNRGEFLRELGLGSANSMAFYCMGTLTSYSTKSNRPPPAGTDTDLGLTGNTDPSKGKVDFILDLTNSTNKDLKTSGKFVNVANIVVANAKGGNLVAIGRICPHQGGSLDYQLLEDDFKYTFHGSLFGTDGNVKPNQLAQSDVKLYKTIVSANGNKLQIIE